MTGAALTNKIWPLCFAKLPKDGGDLYFFSKRSKIMPFPATDQK